jgi:aspartate racemase
MKTLGLIGGMSWESTASYYAALNQGVKDALGGLHSAKIILNSVDFAEIEQLQHEGDWSTLGKMLADAAQSLERAGAECVMICTNTMHKVVPAIEAGITIPILHIADSTAEQLKQHGIQKVGLLGTRFTMEQDFYKGRLKEHFGIEVLIPNQEDRDTVHNVIYQELCKGIIKDESKQAYLRVIERLQDAGAEAVILGCTEIALLVGQEDTQVKLFDTTQIHSEKGVEWALGQHS